MNSMWISKSRGLVLLVFFLSLAPYQPAQASGVWGTRPLLGYFALTASLETPLRDGVGLNDFEFGVVETIAHNEADQLKLLFLSSEEIVNNPSISLENKKSVIAAMGYNRKVEDIIYTTDLRLRESLPEKVYARLIDWIERRWLIEQALHGRPMSRVSIIGLRAVRSYEIFATRYESKGGAYVVALPDKCLKFANGGLPTCNDLGYQPGSGYSVAISYKSGVGVLVGESGPWNVDDNFWSSTIDPQPRRKFADLAVGMPEAQAAYFNGYNNGLDQYGRKVTAPFAIDLAFKVGDDIGLPPKKNDWITVSFLWTADWGGKANKPGKQGNALAGTSIAPAPTSNIIPQVKTVTPAADGSITHVVKAGETLWAIAVAYNMRVAQIQFLNNMGQTVVIYEGQKLKIKEAGPTWTPAPGTSGPTEFITSGTQSSVLTKEARQTDKSVQKTENAATSQLSKTPSTETPVQTILMTQNLAITSTNSMNVVTKRPEGSSRAFQLNDQNLLVGGLILAAVGILIFGLGWWFSRRSENGFTKKEK
jgi:LysM repeat protein